MRGENFNWNPRGNIFTETAVGLWNELSEGVVGAGTLTIFKKHLDMYKNSKCLCGKHEMNRIFN